MSIRILLTFNAIFALLVSLVLIISPATLAGFFDVEATGVVLQLIQLFGAASVGYGLSSWLMRSSGPSEARTAYLNGGGGGYIVVSVVSAYTVINSLGSPITWAVIAGIFLLGVLFLNFGLRGPGVD
ncbi:MAG: hypothetical protein R3335_09695 [Anaerolineales bacterium]|nr:hypothetical protein [Anaerolineales bacterium]